MTTIAIPQRKSVDRNFIPYRSQSIPFSGMAIMSSVCTLLFLAFIVMYQTSTFNAMPVQTKALWSGLFIIITPAIALVLSVISLRRYVKSHTQVRGMVLAYVAFVINALYFLTALAMPLVLLGFYIVYVYVW